MAAEFDDDHNLDHTLANGSQSQTIRKRKEPLGLRAFSFEELKYQPVEVRARGFTYRGKMMGADENDLYLKGLTRWWVIALDGISELKPIERL